MKKNRELRALARTQLKGSWLEAIGVCLVYYVAVIAANIVPGIGPLIISGPLTLGLLGYFHLKAKGGNTLFENLFDGFKQFSSGLVLNLLLFVFIFLWSLLLFIPGIIKCFSYSMSFFIVRDNPEIGAMAAITKSRKMMKGHKGKLFGLCFSFIGWGFLCILTFGIGFLWLYPYMISSLANFYEDLKENQTTE